MAAQRRQSVCTAAAVLLLVLLLAIGEVKAFTLKGELGTRSEGSIGWMGVWGQQQNWGLGHVCRRDSILADRSIDR